MDTIQAGAAIRTAKNLAASPRTRKDSRKDYGYLLALGLITVAAALLRFHALGNRGLWLDEVMSARISQQGLGQLLQTLREREINMALYYMLLHFWMKIGSSEAFLR
jgi:uncharacterized membrane protein